MSALYVLPDAAPLPAQAATELAATRQAAAQAATIALQLAQSALQGTRIALAGAGVELQQLAGCQLEQARLALEEARADAGLAAEDSLGIAHESVSSAQYTCREMIAPRMQKAARILEQASSRSGNTTLAFIDSALATIDQVAAHVEVMGKGTMPRFEQAVAISRKVADRPLLSEIGWAETAMASAHAQLGEGLETSIQIARDTLALASEWTSMAGSDAIEARLATAMREAQGELGRGMAAFEHLMQFPDAPPAEPTAIEDEADTPLPEVSDLDRAGLLVHYALGHFCNTWNAQARPLADFGSEWFKRAAGFSRTASEHLQAALKGAMHARELSSDAAGHALLDEVIAALRNAAHGLSAERLAATSRPATEGVGAFLHALEAAVADTVGDVDASRRAISADPATGKATADLLTEHAECLRQSARAALATLLSQLKPLQEAVSESHGTVEAARQALDQATPSLGDSARSQVAPVAKAISQAFEAGQHMIQCLMDTQVCMRSAVESLCSGTAQLDHARSLLAIVAPPRD